MVNCNGTLQSEASFFINHRNRGFASGDALFEEIWAVNGEIVFWEEHYFRLMASMRILRMEIPMTFTMEFLKAQMLQVLQAKAIMQERALLRIYIYRVGEPSLFPTTNASAFVIEAMGIENPWNLSYSNGYEVELFKDHYINADTLSTLGLNGQMVRTLAAIFATENDYQDCLLLNGNKQVVGAIQGSLFLVSGNSIKTPDLKSGAQNSVVRKKALELAQTLSDYEVQEAAISPFELQKATELFVLGTRSGIMPITQYRKKTYDDTVATSLAQKLTKAYGLVSSE